MAQKSAPKPKKKKKIWGPQTSAAKPSRSQLAKQQKKPKIGMYNHQGHNMGRGGLGNKNMPNLAPPLFAMGVDSAFQKHEVWSELPADREGRERLTKAQEENDPKKPRWSLPQIVQILQDKILQRKGTPSFQMRELFGVQGSSFQPLKPEDLQLKMRLLGIHMTKDQAVELFNKLDVEGKGQLGLNEFLTGILPKDYVNYRGEDEEYWVKARHDDIDRKDFLEKLHGQQAKEGRKKIPEIPAHAPKHSSIASIIENIQEKVYARTNTIGKGPIDRLFNWFGSGHCTPELFRTKIADLGIILTEEENAILFDLMDSNKRGHLDLFDLVMAVTPPDYPGGALNYHWRKRTNEMEQEYLAACAEGPGAGLRAFIKEMEAKHSDEWSLSLEETIEKIQAKLEQRTPGGEKHLRVAYRMFDKKKGGGGISKNEFRLACAEMGFVLTPEDIDRFYNLHDKDRDGKLDMREFGEAMAPAAGIAPRSLCRQVLPAESEMPTATNADNERRRREAPPAKCGCGAYQARKPPNPPYQSVARVPLDYGVPESEEAEELRLQLEEALIQERRTGPHETPSSRNSRRTRPSTARTSRASEASSAFRWVIPEHQTERGRSRNSEFGIPEYESVPSRPGTSRPGTSRREPKAPPGPKRSPYAAPRSSRGGSVSRPGTGGLSSRVGSARPATARISRGEEVGLGSSDVRGGQTERASLGMSAKTNQGGHEVKGRKGPYTDPFEASGKAPERQGAGVDSTKEKRPMSARGGATSGRVGMERHGEEEEEVSWLTKEQIMTARRTGLIAAPSKPEQLNAPTPPPRSPSKTKPRTRPATARTARSIASSTSSWVGPV